MFLSVLFKYLKLSKEEIKELESSEINERSSLEDILALNHYQFKTISEEKLDLIKKEFAGNILERKVKGSELLREHKIGRKSLKTGLECFDNLFEPNCLLWGDVIEIFGKPGSGKSHFIYSLIINRRNFYNKIYFLDTRNKLSIHKLDRMMTQANMTKSEKSKFLKKISAMKFGCGNVESVFETLYEISKQEIEEKTIVIIDSITVLHHLHLNDIKSANRFLSEIMQQLRKLTKRNVTFFITNTSKIDENDFYEEKASCGKIWSSFADHKIHINNSEIALYQSKHQEIVIIDNSSDEIFE